MKRLVIYRIVALFLVGLAFSACAFQCSIQSRPSNPNDVGEEGGSRG